MIRLMMPSLKKTHIPQKTISERSAQTRQEHNQPNCIVWHTKVWTSHSPNKLVRVRFPCFQPPTIFQTTIATTSSSHPFYRFSTMWALYSTFLLGILSHLHPLNVQSTHPGHGKKLISICRWKHSNRIVISTINKERQSVQWTSRFINSSCQLSITNIDFLFLFFAKIQFKGLLMSRPHINWGHAHLLAFGRKTSFLQKCTKPLHSQNVQVLVW